MEGFSFYMRPPRLLAETLNMYAALWKQLTMEISAQSPLVKPV
jgi:hypothetical protein